METYVAVVGVVPSIEAWEVDMRALKFPYDSTGDGKEDCYVRCGVCPVRLYKIIHPEKQQGNLMNHLGIGGGETHITKNHPHLRKYVALMRKVLGIKKCPYAKNPVGHMQPNTNTKAVGVMPIGFRKDIFEDGKEFI